MNFKTDFCQAIILFLVTIVLFLRFVGTSGFFSYADSCLQEEERESSIAIIDNAASLPAADESEFRSERVLTRVASLTYLPKAQRDVVSLRPCHHSFLARWPSLPGVSWPSNLSANEGMLPCSCLGVFGVCGEIKHNATESARAQ